MTPVFVSHTSADEEIAGKICDALNHEGVATWISFRDIPAGAKWEQSIESALEAAKSVLVIVSPKSVGSDYVRAEVEKAIRQHKTVIPVIVQSVKDLPMRWQMLQNVRWNSKTRKAALGKILSAFPEFSANELREALNDGGRFDDVRRLILRHLEWLPMEYYMSPEYAFKRSVCITPGSRVDCFAGRLDTIGPRAYLYYLGSPYRKPVNVSGRPSAELREFGARIETHAAFLSENLRPTHELAIPRLFKNELAGWKRMIGHYAFLKFFLIIGRRHHYQAIEREGRQRISAAINQRLSSSSRHPLYETQFEMLSYDRILDGIAK